MANKEEQTEVAIFKVTAVGPDRSELHFEADVHVGFLSHMEDCEKCRAAVAAAAREFADEIESGTFEEHALDQAEAEGAVN